MKKIIGLITTAMLCVLISIPAIAANTKDTLLMGEDDVIIEIQNDIVGEDIQSWTEITDSEIDFDYVVPVYVTTNVTANTKKLTDTLEFTDQYRIPAVNNNGDCIGVFKVGKLNGKWKIGSYISGLDFIAAVKHLTNDSAYYIEIPQLSGDFGFLTITDSGEFYNSIASRKSSLANKSADDILVQIKDNEMTGDSDSEGAGVAVSSNDYMPYIVAGLAVILLAGTIAIVCIKRRNKSV